MNLTSVDDVKKMNPDVEVEEFSSFFDLFKSCQMDDGECTTTFWKHGVKLWDVDYNVITVVFTLLVADKDLSESERVSNNHAFMSYQGKLHLWFWIKNDN